MFQQREIHCVVSTEATQDLKIRIVNLTWIVRGYWYCYLCCFLLLPLLVPAAAFNTFVTLVMIQKETIGWLPEVKFHS
jgi:hypothetical protein